MPNFNPSLWRLRLTTLLLAALAAASAVYWALKWSEPSVSPRPSSLPLPAPAIDSARVAQLLGASGAATPAATQPTGNALGKFKLLGVIAQGRAGARGSALISIDGEKAKPYRVGDRLGDALVLHSVSARSVALAPDLQSPPSLTLELPPLSSIQPGPATAAAPASTQPPSPSTPANDPDNS